MSVPCNLYKDTKWSQRDLEYCDSMFSKWDILPLAVDNTRSKHRKLHCIVTLRGPNHHHLMLGLRIDMLFIVCIRVSFRPFTNRVMLHWVFLNSELGASSLSSPLKGLTIVLWGDPMDDIVAWFTDALSSMAIRPVSARDLWFIW